MKKSIDFTTRVEKIASKGGWHYVLLPDPVREELRKQSGKNGNIPVLVTIGKTTYPSTIMSMGNQRWFVAIKAEVRRDENISKGDRVSLKLAVDYIRLTR